MNPQLFFAFVLVAAALACTPGVERLTSTLVMKNLKSNAGPPV